MYKTERILIKQSHSHFKQVRSLCRLSAKISNQALYYFRQGFFNHDLVKWAAIDKLLKLKHADLYDAIPNAISQSVIKKTGTDFDSFWQAHKRYKSHPDKFKARPNIPNYRQSKTAIQPAQGMSIKDGLLIFPKKSGLAPLSIHCAKQQLVLAKLDKAIVKEIRYVPHGSCYWVEIVYDEAYSHAERDKLDKDNNQGVGSTPVKKKVKLNPDNAIGLDLGINNLVTLVSNKPELKPVLFSGRPVKSLNQRFNKRKADLTSKGHKQVINHMAVVRFCRINDYFHKVSYHIVKYCLDNDIGKIVIGKNKDWKQDLNIGKVNNQKFVSIPYQSLIEKITYKAQAYGIDVIEQEESYTSKADSLALDELPVFDKNKRNDIVFSGKRKYRGLYQSSIGKLINADVNGAINILRKVIGDGFVKGLADKGAVFTPLRWKPAQ